jgi:hypothetical protein
MRHGWLPFSAARSGCSGDDMEADLLLASNVNDGLLLAYPPCAGE